MFSQRAPETEVVTAEALHPIGVEVLVHKRIDAGPTGAFVVLEALRWLSLVSVSDGAGYQIAEVAPVRVDAEDAAGEVPALFEAVRERARKAAAALPESERAVEMIDEIEDPERLADVVTANLPCPVEDKARYAAEPSLAGRLRMVLAFLDGAAPAAK
jgi:ATP-dependent Lon protease